MHLSPGCCGVCFPLHWSSSWAEPGLSFCFPAVQLPSGSLCRCWEHQQKQVTAGYQPCQLSSSALLSLSPALQALALPLACANGDGVDGD